MESSLLTRKEADLLTSRLQALLLESSLLTRKEAAQYLRIGVSTLRTLKEIPVVRIKSRCLYTQKSLDKYILNLLSNQK